MNTFIGYLDVEQYKIVSSDIITDEVIITQRQIDHIQQRHPEDYETFFPCFAEIIKEPDYILKADYPNTALILKEVSVGGQPVKMILRLAVSADNPDHKNSVITFMRIHRKEWKRLLKNKIILYKRA